MTLRYGFVKGRLALAPALKGSRHRNETQYHLRFALTADGQRWDAAVNVGTDDRHDLLKYKLERDFRHPLLATLGGAEAGARELTGAHKLPALDFVRSDVLAGTGPWRDSAPMDGSEGVEPAASLQRALEAAREHGHDVYLFGRFYEGGDLGIHDVHMNQGSRGGFVHHPGSDRNDHNDIWQDGAVFIDDGRSWTAFFAAFNQQFVPTDDLGNAVPGAKTI